MPLHLWYWESDHAPGETAEDARRWLAEASGMPLEDCGELDEWSMLPDDTVMLEEDGTPCEPRETAAEVAAAYAALSATDDEKGAGR